MVLLFAQETAALNQGPDFNAAVASIGLAVVNDIESLRQGKP